MNIEFLKCHGSGNDFIIIDEWTKGYRFTEEERKEAAIQLSRRNSIIGSDGILFVIGSSNADAKMRMFNSDGSEAEMCGNGLRCVARYAIEKLKKESLMIETMKAILPAAKVPDVYEGIQTFEVAIEPVSLNPASLPLQTGKASWKETIIPEIDKELTFTALSVPNPHLVTIVEKVSDEQVKAVGKKANELKQLLPNGTNVSFVKIINESTIFVRTYERGVGLTNACGTAMSAATLVSCLLGRQPLNEVITVLNPGGMVQTVAEVRGDESYSIKLRGNATYEFSGSVQLDFHNAEKSDLIETQDFPEETAAYKKMADYAKTMA
ncbi:diaminopimelate epimerase [Alkalicoccus halolimnae]|uniref:Diaminopimelate epimerase n=1 Tax=Alkalicoccus halolimnae TaxID=1667239 RepID=A0A5C7F6Z1_9BACI|nr:diaminopimelate epimerase [Alkalicoccus halolimnae]TXF86481.1 diaminopimelate epimerase [Alkalicoccus halolimnae]